MEMVTTRLKGCRRWRESRQVMVCVVYEDYSTGTRASELCRSLCEQLGPRAEFLKRMWGFNELRMSRLRAIAASEAAASELIILSMHDAEALAPEAEQWMQSWLKGVREQSGMVVALLDSAQSGHGGGLNNLLAAKARQAGMEYLALRPVRQDGDWS